MTDVNGETMRLTAASVPAWAVQKAAHEMSEKGIRVAQASIILYAIGKLIGLSDDQLREFAQPKPGRKTGAPFRNGDSFLADLEQESTR